MALAKDTKIHYQDNSLDTYAPRGYALRRRLMRIFKNKLFHKWAKKTGLTDNSIKKAMIDIEMGLHCANLGRNLYKKRIALTGKGKRSSLRTIVAIKKEDKAFFIYGYAKNVRTNINSKELVALVRLAEAYLSYNDKQITKATTLNKIVEVL